MYSIFLTILFNCRTIDCDVLDRQITSKKKDLGCEFISKLKQIVNGKQILRSHSKGVDLKLSECTVV